MLAWSTLAAKTTQMGTGGLLRIGLLAVLVLAACGCHHRAKGAKHVDATTTDTRHCACERPEYAVPAPGPIHDPNTKGSNATEAGNPGTSLSTGTNPKEESHVAR